jgi:hypothetical protein
MLNFIKNLFNTSASKFSTLKDYSHKDKYFYRIAPWDWLTESEITIIDPNRPRVWTLDEWPQMVFLDANGKLSVSQYIDHIANQYNGKVPKGLDDTIIYQIDQLVEDKLIALSDFSVKVDERHDMAMSKQQGFKDL